MEYNLYNELEKVRVALKSQLQTADGRVPVICTDNALKELARVVPRSIEEMAEVNGLGDTFVAKYGDCFLPVLRKYYDSKSKMVKNTDELKATLSVFESRLVNINRRNRLLYMPKIQKRMSFDLFCEYDEKLNDGLVRLSCSGGRSVMISDIRPKKGDAERNEKNGKRMASLLPLVREVAKDFRETGEHDLYLAYPFVIGKMQGEDFNVRAPLMLQPIKLIREADCVSISIDDTKDSFYNTNLILLHNKCNSINKDLPSNIVEVSEDPRQAMLKFFKENGIDIKTQESSFFKFAEYKADEFPEFCNGEFMLEENMVLGKFSLYSSDMQKDIKALADSDEIAELVGELICGYDQLERDNTYVEEVLEPQQSYSFKEKDINYINELNSSQENVVSEIDRKDKLVIQGPPGTGKSQTITSLVADSVIKGRNVVVVSQKKAALDVIDSRLGDLSNFTLLISDTKNKNEFYGQMQNMMLSSGYTDYDMHELDNKSQLIDKNIAKLDGIAENVYQNCKYGKEIYKIYQENTTNQFIKDKSSLLKVFSVINKNLLNEDYCSITRICQKFLNERLAQESCKNAGISVSYPWLKDIKSGLGSIEQLQMFSEMQEYAGLQKEFMAKNIIARFFGAGKRKKSLKALLSKYFNGVSKKDSTFKSLYLAPQNITAGLEHYQEYLDTLVVFNSLSEVEKQYIFAMSSVIKTLGIDSATANKVVYDFVVFGYLDSFEKENKVILTDISYYNDYVSSINESITSKKDLTRTRLESELRRHFADFIGSSKRYNSMKQSVEGKRKPSVGRFVQKYGFQLFRGIRVWLMTPEVASEILPREKGVFDLLIYDEASQMYVERGIPVLSRASKVVVAGDHKQLKPSSLGQSRIDYDDMELDEEAQSDSMILEEDSLLDLARFKYPEVLLDYHYRSKYEELIAFSNYAFYGGRLNVSPNFSQPKKPPITVIKVEDGCWIKRSNEAEAKRTIELIKEFFSTRKNDETLGVITFNSNQRDLIMDMLDKECVIDKDFRAVVEKEFERKHNGEDVGMFIKNIENVQGDERDCIMFSTAYAKNEAGKVVNSFGWLNVKGGENRLNVAISRAKQKIYLVTSIKPYELSVDMCKNDGPRIFKAYLEYCNAISCGDNVMANQILMNIADKDIQSSESTVQDSKFENLVYNALCERGLIVDRQVGIGGYKIDLAIKDKDTGEYLLGVECDGKLYQSCRSSRDRDIHRGRYLESRGWTIHRIWSSNWWHDSNAEVDKIVTMLKQSI